MKKFRLKKEAVPFFKEKHATSIYTWDIWEKLQVDDSALEEVREPYILYGINKGSHSTCGGWNEKDGKTFEFTILFPDVKWQDHDKFSGGRIVRDLMDNIQYQIDLFYDKFNSNPE